MVAMKYKPYNVTTIAPYISMQRKIHISLPAPQQQEGRNGTVSNGSTAKLAEFRVFPASD